MQLYIRMKSLGVECFRVILIENFSCATKAEILKREDHYIQTLNPPLNKYRASVSDADRRKRKAEYQKAKRLADPNHFRQKNQNIWKAQSGSK